MPPFPASVPPAGSVATLLLHAQARGNGLRGASLLICCRDALLPCGDHGRSLRVHAHARAGRPRDRGRARGERLRTRFIGPWGPWRSRLVRVYFAWLNGVRPLRIDGREGIWSLYFPPIPSAAHGSVIEAYLNTFLVKRQAPAAVTIGVTDACQYACVHCSALRRNGDEARPGAAAAAPLTLDELKRVVDESIAAGCGNVSFTGGEPLLYPHLEELVAHVPRDRAVAQVFTNGRELTEERAAALAAAGLHSVQVSVDSPMPEEHDRLRGEAGAFAAARRAVAAARRAGLLVGVSTYATPASVRRGDVPSLARLAASWGACELTVFDAIPTGRLLGDTSVVSSKADRRRLLLQSWTTNRAASGVSASSPRPGPTAATASRASSDAWPATASSMSPRPASSSPATSCRSPSGTCATPPSATSGAAPATTRPSAGTATPAACSRRGSASATSSAYRRTRRCLTRWRPGRKPCRRPLTDAGPSGHPSSRRTSSRPWPRRRWPSFPRNSSTISATSPSSSKNDPRPRWRPTASTRASWASTTGCR